MPNTLHILHISTATSWRGGEQQAAYLAEELKAAGIRQTIFCVAGGEFAKRMRTTGLTVITAQKSFSTNPAFASKLARTARKVGATVMHCHDSHALSFGYMATTLFRNKIPLVASRRINIPIGKGFFSLKKYRHPIVGRILCVSNAIRDMVRPSLDHPEVAQTVYSGIDLKRYRPDSAPGKLRKQLEISPDVPLVGTVAALAELKDYPTWLQTVHQLVNDGCKAHFVMVGDGPMKAEITALRDELQLQEHVSMIGFRNDVPDLLPELDVLLFTSKSEGLGTTLSDTLASGTPIVTTRAGGIPEVIPEGEHVGLLADVGDANTLASHVQRLLNDASLREQLRNNGLERAKQFSKEEMARQTLAVYRELCL